MIIMSVLRSNIKTHLKSFILRTTLYNCNTQKIDALQIFKVNVRTFGTLQKPSNTFSSRFQLWYKNFRGCNTFSKLKVDKIINNVILYKYDQSFFYRVIAVFSVVQIICLWTAATNVYTVYHDEIFATYDSWAEKIGKSFIPIGIITLLGISGPLILFLLWFMSIKCVKFLFLLRGGNKVQFVTYHPIKGEYIFTVPLEKITCINSRSEGKGYMKLYIKDKSFHYILDRKGIIPEPQLFDQTVGVCRKL